MDVCEGMYGHSAGQKSSFVSNLKFHRLSCNRPLFSMLCDFLL